MIPEAAVEAANEAVLREFGTQLNPAVVDAILEAAAPHIEGASWNEGYKAGQGDAFRRPAPHMTSMNDEAQGEK